MKALSVALRAHLDEGTTTLSWCWRITRADGVVLGFTDHDRVLSFAGARSMMIEIAPGDTVPGTLVLFRMAPRAIAKHVGILTAPDRFLHSYERLGVIEEPLTPVWRRRIAFAFLYPNSSV